MLFTTTEFFVFAGITFFVYYLYPKKQYQVPVLLLASFIFYAWSIPLLLLLLIFSISINAVTSFLIARAHSLRLARIWAISGVGVNLALLCGFKYASLLGSLGIGASESWAGWLYHLPLPIGISFFTFEGISLVVDTFRETARHPERSQRSSDAIAPKTLKEYALRIALFIAFFPHLIAGPILKAREFLPQITAKTYSEIDLNYCFRHLVIGYFLKSVVADNLKEITNWIAFPQFQTLGSVTLIALLFGFSIQIFADFAGYSLIALGLAGLFGYRLQANFNFPYISTSFSEFWRRWHISLSSFLKEYLYIPLGGNRQGTARTYVNLLTTMVLGGLWHGASWSFAVWGLAHGMALVVERAIVDLSGKVNISFHVPNPLKALWVFTYVTAAWLLFKLPNFGDAIQYFQAIAQGWHGEENYTFIAGVLLFSAPVIGYHALQLLPDRLREATRKCDSVVFGLLLFLITMSSGNSQEFIYFQF